MGGLTKHSNSYHQWFGDSLANAGGPHSPVGHIFRFTTDVFPYDSIAKGPIGQWPAGVMPATTLLVTEPMVVGYTGLL